MTTLKAYPPDPRIPAKLREQHYAQAHHQTETSCLGRTQTLTSVRGAWAQETSPIP